jgi:hypothetical protein
MHRIVRILATSTLALLAPLLAETPSFARTEPASAGHAYYPSQASCFGDNNYGGNVVNTCSTAAWFIIPLVTDNAGANTTTYAFGPGPNSNVGCQAIGMSNGYLSWVDFWVPQLTYLPAFGGGQALNSYAYFPNGGTAFVKCLVESGGGISVVQW